MPRRKPSLTAAAPAARMDSTGSTGAGINAYDAASDSRNRSSFISFPVNSRRELTPSVRREIVKKSRALEANCPFLTRIIRKFARHAVGSGIHFRILSEDEAFNDAARRDVEEWWNNPAVYSIDSSVDGWEAKRVAAETILLDGEYNAVQVVTAGGWPMLQPLDVFEIETPPTDKPAEFDDGVRISAFDRPIAFSVRELPKAGEYHRNHRPVPAESMIHIGRRRRARGHRFMPATYSGLNCGIDALDLNSLITGTAKLHSALAVQVKRDAKRGKKGAVGAISSLGTGEVAADTAALEKVFGSMINYVGENGEIDLKSSQHPTANVLEFLRILFAQMSLGFDVPFSVMWSLSEVGGTAVRSDMEDAQSSFDLLYDLIVWRFVRREVIWKISKAIQTGRLAMPRDPLWFSKIVFRGPRKLTVDVGRMATAFKTLTRNAGMSIPRFLEEQGLDAYEEMRDHIKFLSAVRVMCEEHHVDFATVFEPTPGSQTNITVQQPDTP